MVRKQSFSLGIHLQIIVNIVNHQNDVSSSTIVGKDIKQFEFVTLTSQPTTITTKETSKTVRKQAMKDYLRKQNRQATTGIVELVKGVHPKEPAQYKGKFKLNTWSHKTKTKAILARKVKLYLDSQEISTREDSSPPNESPISGPLTHVNTRQRVHNEDPCLRIFSPITSSLDPFDTLAIRLGPLSEDLLAHCMTSLLSSYPQVRRLIKIR